MPAQTGLPARLRDGIEALSGLAMDDVRVHRHSPEPTKLGALAFARGSDIHLGPGQERHLPHEAWHVVQQKQGRVGTTAQLKGVGINADAGLEAEADRMGAETARATAKGRRSRPVKAAGGVQVVQRTVLIDGKTELAKTDAVSPVLEEFIGKPETYWLADNFKNDLGAAVVHLLDATKKYIIGEIHDKKGDIAKTSRWALEIVNWAPVPKMTEYGMALPPTDYAAFGVPSPAVDPQAQPLESTHAYLLARVIRAHDYLNAIHRGLPSALIDPLAPSTRLRVSYAQMLEQRAAVSLAGVDKVDVEPILEQLGQIELSCLEYIDFANAKKPLTPGAGSSFEKVGLFSQAVKTSHVTELKRLRALIENYRDEGAMWDLKGTRWSTSYEELAKVRKVLPLMADQLLAIVGTKDAAEAKKVTDLLGHGGDTVHESAALHAAKLVRERAMVANITAAEPPPLLVQIGNAHVGPVAGDISNAVPIPLGKSLADETEQPKPGK